MFGSEKSMKQALIAAAILLVVFGFLFFGEHSKRSSLERQLNEVNTKLASTQAALSSANKEVDTLAQKLQMTDINLRNTTEELNNLKETKKELMAQLDQVREELQKQVYEKLDLKQRLDKAKEEVKSIQDELGKMEAVRADLEAKIKDIEATSTSIKSNSNIELGQVVVGGEGVAKAVPAQPRVKPTQPLNGTVLVVNKEYNFAVINLGNKDGLGPDDTIAVYDKEKFIGDVKVEKLQEAMAAVNFLTPRLKDKLVAEKEYVFKVK
ncbi:MAG: hypothetical protein PHH69_00675 [Candidatus Omnitrophica bacterium]|nr:hypothetical protein [Candidatus Omnitrophota bacterium]